MDWIEKVMIIRDLTEKVLIAEGHVDQMALGRDWMREEFMGMIIIGKYNA